MISYMCILRKRERDLLLVLEWGREEKERGEKERVEKERVEKESVEKERVEKEREIILYLICKYES